MAYADDLAASEAKRQSSKMATNTAAGHLAADQAHYAALITAGKKWGVQNNAMQALINLGGVPPAGSY